MFPALGNVLEQSLAGVSQGAREREALGQLGVQFGGEDLSPFVGHRKTHRHNAGYPIGRHLFGHPTFTARNGGFASAQDQDFDTSMLAQGFAQGGTADLFFIAVFIFKIQDPFVLRGVVGSVAADVDNVVLAGVQGFV